MNFAQAVRSVLSQYGVFRGRARRSEYWWFFLFNVIVSVIASIVDRAIGSPVLAIVVALALVVPGLAVTFRRLHDTGRSAWWILIGLIPLVGGIVLIVFACQDSNYGDNQYGPSPKRPAVGGGYAAGYPAQS